MLESGFMGQRARGEVSTVARPRPVDSPRERAAYRITIVEGADRGRGIAVDESTAGRVLVGQSPVCQLRLDDAHVSRRHAAFDLAGARLRVSDLASTNGTW